MKKKQWVTVVSIFLVMICLTTVCVTKSLKWEEVQIQLDSNYNELFTFEEMKDKGHVSICEEYLTKDSIGYNNNDGTKTLYIYASQINLQKGNDFTQIDTRIKNTTDSIFRNNNYIYTVCNNDIKSYYNRDFNDIHGVLLKKGNSYFEITKNHNNSLAEYKECPNFIGEKKYMITYDKVISNAILKFYPSRIGSNCEIDYQKLNQNKFDLNLTVSEPDIKLNKEKGGYIILTKNTKDKNEKASTEIIGVIQKPLIKNKENGVSYKNNIEYQKISDNQYKLTFELDNKYVGDEALVYISFEMRREKQPDNAIYSKLPNLTNAYLCNYSVIGNNEDYGIGRQLIRYNFVKFFGLHSKQIKKANYYLYSLTNNKDQFELLTVLEDWCSITGNWNNNYKTGSITSMFDLHSKEMNFNITKEVKKWCNADDGQMEHNGVMLKSITEMEGVYNIILSNDNALFKNKTEIIIKGEK